MGDAAWNPRDATADVVISASADIVSSLSQGPFRQLTSGIRADIGARRGRHLFEVRVLDRVPDAWQCELRMGVSTRGSSLLIKGSSSAAVFDHSGAYSALAPGAAASDAVPSAPS